MELMATKINGIKQKLKRNEVAMETINLCKVDDITDINYLKIKYKELADIVTAINTAKSSLETLSKSLVLNAANAKQENQRYGEKIQTLNISRYPTKSINDDEVHEIIAVDPIRSTKYVNNLSTCFSEGAYGKMYRTTLISVVKQHNNSNNNQLYVQVGIGRDKDVIIKIFKSSKLVQKEYEIMRLIHDVPGVAKLAVNHLSIDAKNNAHCIGLKYIYNACPLCVIFKHGIKMSFKKAHKIMMNLLNIMNDLYAKHVLELSISAGNIMLNFESNDVTLTDFGTSVMIKWSEDVIRIKCGEHVGSPPYAAPETRAGFASYQSDIFSTGIIGLKICFNIDLFENILDENEKKYNKKLKEWLNKYNDDEYSHYFKLLIKMVSWKASGDHLHIKKLLKI